MALSVAAMAAVAGVVPAAALRSSPRVRLAPPRPAPRGGRRPALRVRASVHEDDKPADGGEGVGRYLARAAASLFTPADDHSAPFTVMPYSGTKLTAKDRAHLARYEQVLRKTQDTLDAMPADAPHEHAKHEHKDIGHWLAEAASTVFTKPDVADEQLFKGTLSGWSGDVPQRKRMVTRLDAFRNQVSELKDKAPRE